MDWWKSMRFKWKFSDAKYIVGCFLWFLLSLSSLYASGGWGAGVGLPYTGPGYDLRAYRGQYTLEKVLGRGAAAKVFLAQKTDETDGTRVALKVYYDAKDVSAENEVAFLRMVDHPHLMKMTSVVSSSPYILELEYMPGSVDLVDFINYGYEGLRINEEGFQNIFYQVLLGLDALHTQKIVHRDIKPENILINRTPKGFLAKLIDFGLSYNLDVAEFRGGLEVGRDLCPKSETGEHSPRMTERCGTTNYASPELYRRQLYSSKTDIWSFGVTLYAALTGRLPFEVKGNFGYLARDYTMQPNFWRLSSEAQAVIEACLTIDPDKRPTTKGLLRMPWFDDAALRYAEAFRLEE
jgi:Neu-associated kinase